MSFDRMPAVSPVIRSSFRIFLASDWFPPPREVIMLRESSLPVFSRFVRLLSLLVLPALAALPACKYDSADVEWTIPARGDSEIMVQPVIAVRLTNTMTASDIANTESAMIPVTGDQTSGEYSGTIVAANEQDVFSGQTIAEFQAGINQPPEIAMAQISRPKASPFQPTPSSCGIVAIPSV